VVLRRHESATQYHGKIDADDTRFTKKEGELSLRCSRHDSAWAKKSEHPGWRSTLAEYRLVTHRKPAKAKADTTSRRDPSMKKVRLVPPDQASLERFSKHARKAGKKAKRKGAKRG